MTRYKRQKAAVDFAHPFAEFVWNEINARKLSHTDVAKAAKVSPRTLRRWRDGELTPTLDALENVLDMLGFELVVRTKFVDGRE